MILKVILRVVMKGIIYSLAAMLALAGSQISAIGGPAESLSKDRFFYSIPEEADNSWAYQIPECASLTPKQSNSIVKCEKSGKNETCQTKDSVHLSNVLNKGSKDFKLIYHVFTSKSACVADREAALSEE